MVPLIVLVTIILLIVKVLGTVLILSLSLTKLFLPQIPTLMDNSMKEIILIMNTYKSSLNNVIKMVTNNLTLVKSTIVLFQLKMNGELNIVLILTIFTVLIHTNVKFVMVLGTAKIFIMQLLNSSITKILTMMDLSIMVMKSLKNTQK